MPDSVQSPGHPSLEQRIAVLDGLRAMAIILVLMRHMIRPFWTDARTPFLPLGHLELGNIFLNGWMGVDLFFVLSGFLITSHLLERHFHPSRWVTDYALYARRRFFRIAPAYYFVLTLVVLGLFPFFPYPSSHDNLFGRYILHLVFLQDYWPDDMNVVFWSLGVEIKFYLAIPFIILVLKKISTVRGQLAVLFLMYAALMGMRAIVLSGRPEMEDYTSYFLQVRTPFHLTFDGLMIGTFCAVLWNDIDCKRRLSRHHIPDFLCCAGLGGFFFLSFGLGPLVDLGTTFFDKFMLPVLINASFGMILLGLLGGANASRFFGARLWLPIALVSYSLYLLHLPLLYPAEVLCRQFFDLDSFLPPIQLLVYTPFFLFLAGLAATLCYLWIERPFLSRSKTGPS